MLVNVCGSAEALTALLVLVTPALRRLQLRSAELRVTRLAAMPWRSLCGLVELDVSHNWLGEAAAAAIPLAQMPTLETLKAARTGLGPDAVGRLNLRRAPRLRLLDLSDNPLGARGHAALVHVLAALPALAGLMVAHSGPGPDGARALLRSAAHHPSLQYVELGRSDVEPSVARELNLRPYGHARLRWRRGDLVAETSQSADGPRHWLWRALLRLVAAYGNALVAAGV